MGANSSRQVKLAKDQAPVYIQPRDLHQPIVPQPQLNVHKCNECGHPLSPAVEPWTIGISDCADDREICLTGLFCPCVLYGRNVERIRDGETSWITHCICHAIFVEGGIALAAGITAFHCIGPMISYVIYNVLVINFGICVVCTTQVRESMQEKYQLENSPCEPCEVHFCMHWCAICQEHREMEYRLLDNAVMPMTNAPPLQKMKADDDDDDKRQDFGSSSSANSINKMPT